MKKTDLTEADLDNVMRLLDTVQKVHALPDHELTQMVERHVWAKLAFCGAQEWLVDELINRFEKRAGVHRDSEGRVVRMRPKIVCLCGSTRFTDAFQQANLRETIAGNIVLSIGCNTKSDSDLIALGELTPEKKAALDELHKRKIDLCDEVLVLNVDGYIGASTRSEILYAYKHDKPVRYLEPPASED